MQRFLCVSLVIFQFFLTLVVFTGVLIIYGLYRAKNREYLSVRRQLKLALEECQKLQASRLNGSGEQDRSSARQRLNYLQNETSILHDKLTSSYKEKEELELKCQKLTNSLENIKKELDFLKTKVKRTSVDESSMESEKEESLNPSRVNSLVNENALQSDEQKIVSRGTPAVLEQNLGDSSSESDEDYSFILNTGSLSRKHRGEAPKAA